MNQSLMENGGCIRIAIGILCILGGLIALVKGEWAAAALGVIAFGGLLWYWGAKRPGWP